MAESVRRLHTKWEARVFRTAVASAVVALVVLVVLAFALRSSGKPLAITLPAAALASGGLYELLTRKLRRRREILAQPFPLKWLEVLEREVIFYRALDPVEQLRFRRELQVFLGEKLITGVNMQLDETTRVLAAVSAVIPIFGFPDWEWNQISEVLIYPTRFSDDFAFGDGQRHHTLGMVGTGAMNRMMILAKPDLHHGFRNSADKRNVGLHEFAHLVDKSDGTIDGLPEVGLDRQSIGPWIELVRRKMEEIRRGDSDIDDYALTNEAEFFAVATEYFFERPGVMQRKHPVLYETLSKVFNQRLHERVAALARERKRGRPTFGRNSPCLCGSGKKYKRCCLPRARAEAG